MSSNGKKNDGIPWWLIILLFCIAPVGAVALLVAKLINENKTSSSTTYRDQTSNGMGTYQHNYTNQTSNGQGRPNKNQYSPTRQQTTQSSQNSSGYSYVPKMTVDQSGQKQGTTTRDSSSSAAKSTGNTAKTTAPQAKTSYPFCTFLKVFGGINLGISGITALTMISDYSPEKLAFLLFFLVTGAGSLIWSHFRRKRKHNEALYKGFIGNRDHFSTARLSAVTNQSVSKVERELRRMISHGEFGDVAYIDSVSHQFMRSPSVILETDSGTSGTSQKTKKQTDAADSKQTADNDPLGKEYSTILKQIRQLDDDIADEAVSQRIQLIEQITRTIFEYIVDHPEKKGQIRTFMNYYLPTTMKLLETYKTIERVGPMGSNMQESKERIENTLDLLVLGFEKQMDQLFQSENLDISADIEVLEQMMRKDGLVNHSDFDEFIGAEEISESESRTSVDDDTETYSDEITETLDDSDSATQKKP